MTTQYMSQEKKEALQQELCDLKQTKIPDLARRIDEARQMGDLSENAEYHAAREEMAWTQSRVKELCHIIENAEIVNASSGGNIKIGSHIIVKVNGNKKEYFIVGTQEADPLSGKISHESPLGSAFLNKKKGDKVDVKLPAGLQEYKIIDVI